MTALFQARLQLDERLTPTELAGFETVFSELLDAAATAHLRDGGGDWLIEALFTDPPAEDAVAALLAPVFADCGLTPVPVAITPLAQRDWLAGSHVETPPPLTSWPLLVEAAQAFGSGTHPTTEGCLRAAEAILRRDRRLRWRALDMGCGSAILGLGLLKARPGTMVVAADNDILAVTTAAENARINHLPPLRVKALLSQGYADPAVRRRAPHDLIFANILAGPLCGMARDQMAALVPHGWLVLSGILNQQAVMVERRYAAAGARITARLTIGDWTTLVLRPARLGRSAGLWHPRGTDSAT